MGLKAVQVSNQDYSEKLAKLQDIPTLPVVATRVNELINDPTSTSEQIADVLKKDQVLVAKVLRLVNSSYYSIPGGVTDVQRALAFLGFNTVAQLVLGVSVFSVFKDIPESEFNMPEFWKHALATAVASEIIAKKINYPKPEEAFTCGLLHDIGKLVMFVIDPERLKHTVSQSTKRKCSFIEIEREDDLPAHPFLGEMIATRWGLPQVIRLVVRYHHTDVSNMSTILRTAKPAISIVRVSNQIAIQMGLGKSGDCSTGEIDDAMLAPIGLSPSDIEEIKKQIDANMDRASVLLGGFG